MAGYYPDIVGDGIAARKAGYDEMDKFSNALARRQAGNAMASGDATGGQNMLYRAGLFDEAGQVQDRQYRNEYLGFQRDNMKANAEEKQRERAANERKERGEFFMRAADAIGQIPDDGTQAGRRKALQTLLPTFQAMGIDQQSIQALMTADLSDQSLAMFKGNLAKELKLVEGQGGELGTWNGREYKQLRAPSANTKPDWKEIKRADGSTYWKDFNAAGPASAAPSAPAGSASAGFDAHIGPLLQREGGFVARDGRSGAPANFGINQKYNPDVDVKNLTADKAKELYRSRYWNAIGGDTLPPQAQAAVFDAAVNQGPQRAMQWWQQSGGDLAKFNELRLAHYRSRPDYAQNKASWEGRVAETGGGGRASAPASQAGIIEGDEAGAKEGWRPDPTTPGFLVNDKGDVKEDPRAKPPADKTTEAERTAAFLSSRLASSLQNITSVAAEDPGATKPGLLETTARNLPIVGGEGTANLVRSGDRQQVVANQIDILDAALTLGTGAAYNREQLEGYRQAYFPTLTDKPETAAAKTRKLIALLKAAQIKAGRAAPPELAAAIASAEQQFGGPGRPASAPRQASGPQQRSPSAQLPAAARQQLKAGHVTTFTNGQRWTLRNGQPVRVN